METNYNKPHHVLLFFKKVTDEAEAVLNEHYQYYQNLKEQGKAIISGNFWNQPKSFVVLLVSCDAELEDIINSDPALQQNCVELVRAMPFATTVFSDPALEYISG